MAMHPCILKWNRLILGEVERRNEGTVEDELGIQGRMSMRENSIIERGALVTGPA